LFYGTSTALLLGTWLAKPVQAVHVVLMLSKTVVWVNPAIEVVPKNRTGC
jgi:hypothetical protein